ncbi:MAG: hypothetical protein KDA58_13410, partial [Planctomycetaceae bacterium]|nr:hypothetical protein [Planctomycetaceae bacterium]
MENRSVRLTDQATEFRRPDGNMRDEVRSARRWLFWFVFTCFAVILAANTDFWIGMPDVTEQLANKCTSLVSQVGNFVSGTSGGQAADAANAATPVGLRVALGIIIVCIWMSLTLGIKWTTDTKDEQSAIHALQPGDDEGYRRLRRVIWLKRLGRIGYMPILIGLLTYLYSFDIERARLVVAARHMSEQTAVDTTDWSQFGLELGENGELSTNEAVPTATNVVEEAAPVDAEQEARNLARPQVLTYSLLAMLHGLLLIIPSGQKPDDWRLAFFKPGPAGEQAAELHSKSQTLFRGLHTQIQDETDPEVRERLIQEAMPVAKQINDAVGSPVFEVPSEAGSQVAAAGNPAQPETPVAMPPSEAQPPFPTAFPPAAAGQQDGPEDPYQAIFG